MFKRLRAALAASLLVAASLIAFVQPAAAFSGPCSGVSYNRAGTGTLYAVAYEFAGYNPPTLPGGSLPWGRFCIYAPSTSGSTTVLNFQQYGFIDGFGGNHCDGQLFNSYGTWNDCISSLQFVSDCHHTLTFYTNEGLDSVAFSTAVSWSGSFSGLVDNTFSSMRITYHSACLN